jgi:hypothetical protein
MTEGLAAGIGGRSNSLKWPHLYDLLRAKGYDKSKSAAISNSRVAVRGKGKLRGLPRKHADNPKKLAMVLKKYNKKHGITASALIAACHSAACAPPPAGTGGSNANGGGGGAGEPAKVDRSKPFGGNVTTEAQRVSIKLAEHLVKRARVLEKGDQITTDFVKVVHDVGGVVMDRGHKLKGLPRLAEKIHDKAMEKGHTLPQSAKNMNDTLRYTAIFPEGRYAEGVQDLVKAMQARGETMQIRELENKWGPEPYKGVHMLVRSATGLTYEVQVHTRRSAKVNKQLHDLYDELRDKTNPPTEERAIWLRSESVRIGKLNPLEKVPGIEQIKDIVFS